MPWALPHWHGVLTGCGAMGHQPTGVTQRAPYTGSCANKIGFNVSVCETVAFGRPPGSEAPDAPADIRSTVETTHAIFVMEKKFISVPLPGLCILISD
jgi:hypothetical protein